MKNVTACDMKKTGLEDNFLEVIVFCLSLMNVNWEDYIKEANRCLVINGTLLIAETTKSLDARLSKLREVLKRYNFQIYL
jgi:ubiquinone/menaquinone biosynthesis C-methylase UbiE